MRKMVALAAVMLIGATMLMADFPEGNWAWFTLDPDNPYDQALLVTYQADSINGVDETITLHAWQKCDDHGVAGMEYVIGWDPQYVEATGMELDPIFDPFMFKGTNYPGDGNSGTIDSLPAARWYAAVCIPNMGCNPLPAGEPYHVGTITLHITSEPVAETVTTCIDTTAYPPSSHTSMADSTGTITTVPEWTPFCITILPPPPTGVEEGTQIPTTYYMNKLTPNPFKSNTAIAYGIPKDTEVNLSVYDATGSKVRTLVSGHVKAGRYTVSWDGLDDAGHRLASGTYFVRLVTKDFSKMEKALLLK